MKFSLLSHILPPSPSGQAMVIYRLLQDLPGDRYCLISNKRYEDKLLKNVSSGKLSAKYYRVKPLFRLPVPKRVKKSQLGIFINSFGGIYSRSRQIKKIIRNEGCGLLIACTGDLYDLPAAWLACKDSGISFVPYMFDDYVYQWTGLCRLISNIIEPVVMKNASKIIVPNEYMRAEYLKRYDLNSTVIHNPCELPDLEALDKAEKVFNEDDVNIVYTGAVYHAHYDAFRSLISALKLMKADNIKLHLYTSQKESELMENGISGQMVVYHSHINGAGISTVQRHADILFLPLAFDSSIQQVIKTSAPGKTGEYLSVGRPVLVHAPRDSFVSGFFRENNCGIVVDRNDPNILSEEISKLISDTDLQNQIGINSRKIAESEFSIDRMRDKFYELVNRMNRG